MQTVVQSNLYVYIQGNIQYKLSYSQTCLYAYKETFSATVVHMGAERKKFQD